MTNTLVGTDFSWCSTLLYPTVPITPSWSSDVTVRLVSGHNNGIPHLETLKIKNWPIKYSLQILENIKIIGPYKDEIWIPKHWTYMYNITTGRQLCTRLLKHEALSIVHSREVPIRRFEFQEDGSVHYLSVRSHTDIITRHGVVYLTSVINLVLRSGLRINMGAPIVRCLGTGVITCICNENGGILHVILNVEKYIAKINELHQRRSVNCEGVSIQHYRRKSLGYSSTTPLASPLDAGKANICCRPGNRVSAQDHRLAAAHNAGQRRSPPCNATCRQPSPEL